MAELHIIGQIVGASGFPHNRLFCVWEATAGGGWTLLQGDNEGQTQVDNPEIDDFALWSHPLDLHYATRGIQGWPKLTFQVWNYDDYNRTQIFAYGVCDIPTTPGEHKIECVTWRPVGGLWERIMRFFLGGGPQLRNTAVVRDCANRHRLYTQSMGIVHLELGIIVRGFENFGVEF